MQEQSTCRRDTFMSASQPPQAPVSHHVFIEVAADLGLSEEQARGVRNALEHQTHLKWQNPGFQNSRS